MITESSQFNIHIHLILLFTFRYELKRFDTKRRNQLLILTISCKQNVLFY